MPNSKIDTPCDDLEGFPAISWEEDRAERVNPEILTQLLRDAVPVLAWVDWRITAIDEGACTSELPLNDESTNQHGTHQAALLGLAADYTGGAALLSLIRGVPALGVHPQPDNDGCAMWLADLQMQYLAPSAGPVRVSAKIPPERWRVVRQTYARGRAIVLEVEIAFEVEGQAVARGSCRYFLKKAANLAPYELDAQPNPIFALRSKASARLIAGLRAQESAQPSPRLRDPWAAALAGPHGEFLARRFSAILPPLRDMVVARTLDVDRLVRERVSEGVEQLVLVGAGLDARPFRLLGSPDQADQASQQLERVRVFELDLPHMLAERQRLLEGLDLPAVDRTAVPFDLRLTTLRDALAGAGFRPDAPAVFVIEGVSMYQGAATMTALAVELRELLAPAGSVAWMDVVRASVLTGTGVAAVDGFITGMQRLGEPFCFGVEEPESWIAEHGLRGRAVTVADAADPIFGFYAFLHLTR